MLSHCVNGNIDEAYKVMSHLWRLGYSGEDIITMVFRVAKNHNMAEFLKLEFIKVRMFQADERILNQLEHVQQCNTKF